MQDTLATTALRTNEVIRNPRQGMSIPRASVQKTGADDLARRSDADFLGFLARSAGSPGRGAERRCARSTINCSRPNPRALHSIPRGL
jgi:hypothetical protein